MFFLESKIINKFRNPKTKLFDLTYNNGLSINLDSVIT